MKQADVSGRIVATLKAVTTLGRTVAATGVMAWVVGWYLGWEEFMVVAAGCLIALGAATAFTVGRASLDTVLEVEPRRLVVGDQAVGRIVTTNSARARTLPVHLEAPVGGGLIAIDVPTLATSQSHEEIFLIPTVRRCVLPVGPVRCVRGDPLGLLRREQPWSDELELFVHPRTVLLSGATSGWLRDLEGQTTNDMSNSDVAFHTLREYVPGDDRRHVHWRTSARLGRLMVRQFVDTRRSHLAVILPTSDTLYSEPDEFELAVSVIASLAISVFRQGQQVTCVTSTGGLPAYSATRLLDGLSGVKQARAGDASLTATAQKASTMVADASVVALVCGGRVPVPALRRAVESFSPDVRVLAIRCGLGSAGSYSSYGNKIIGELGSLDDLPRLMRAVVG